MHRPAATLLLVAAVLVLAASPGLAQPRQPPGPDKHAELNQPFPPHRIADDLYYVGSKQLASYLVTTKKGHILINASFESTVPIIRSNVEQLGFKFTDIKILLNSHAHDDHVEGSALAQEQTGASVYVMQGDEPVIESGGRHQYHYDSHWRPCHVNRVLRDGDKVTLGDATLVAHLTPGHTRGCTTWTMQAREAGKSYDVVIVGSPNVNSGYRLVDNKDYPEIAADYEKSFRIWRALPCDIFLGAHGAYYDLERKFPLLKKDAVNPFIDPAGYRAYIADREKVFRAELEAQRTSR